ncbi:NAD(+)/NADH kinase [Fibrobacter sp. UWEL]|uniref:NAD(+)/NADH kinase n=1 Tax=Fibrobacter sp. UWEL TaxID=1896209 RepID=UPI000917B319|nr:NAD(+)/NADH kinase [Fibrobacter sp. UWEL]SHL05596.1 NAD+ kinase [Fibrobacter sp. UWEL]
MQKITFKQIGIIGWKEKSPELAFALEQIIQWATEHPQVKFCVLENLKEQVKAPIKVVKEPTLLKSDLLLAVGGDGTVLSAAHLALGHKIPILGVNAGHVGFLAETRIKCLPQTLDDLLAGVFSTRDRMMIDATVFHGRKCIAKHTVLNEVHFRAHAPERMVNVNVEYNGTEYTEYWADSLLVSTPTGSTAYNLAAGGPIIHPATYAVVLTPVAPGSLSVRPLIMSLTDKKLVLRPAENKTLDLVFDGRTCIPLEPGDHVVLTQSKSFTTFLRMRHTGFVGALREKLGWTGKRG